MALLLARVATSSVLHALVLPLIVSLAKETDLLVNASVQRVISRIILANTVPIAIQYVKLVLNIT